MKKIYKTFALLSLFMAFVFNQAVDTAHAQPSNFMTSVDVDDLGDGLYAFRYGPYRNIFLVSDEGVIVTDPINVKAAAVLRSEISKITDKPVKYVAYSHSHWDHVSGGQLFKDEGAQFVAQEKCAANLMEIPNAQVVAPDITFSENYTISLGGKSLDLYYFGPSHDNCLVVMVARPANIMFIVDIANPPTGWFMEWNPTMPDTYFYNLIPYLKATEDLAAREGIETFVGGHMSVGRDENGKMVVYPAAGPVSAITERRIFWETVIGAVREEFESGTFTELVASKMDRSSFESKIVGYNKSDMSILIRRIASYVSSGR